MGVGGEGGGAQRRKMRVVRNDRREKSVIEGGKKREGELRGIGKSRESEMGQVSVVLVLIKDVQWTGSDQACARTTR